MFPKIVKPTPLWKTTGLIPKGSNTSLSDLSNEYSVPLTPFPPTTPLLGPATIDQGEALVYLSIKLFDMYAAGGTIKSLPLSDTNKPGP